jgi:hypothetical protein
MAADHGLKVDPLHLRVLKKEMLVFILPPPDPRVPLAPGGTIGAAPPAAPALLKQNRTLPTGRAPNQVLVKLDRDGKLVVKSAVTGFQMDEQRRAPGEQSIGTKLVTTVRSDTFRLDDVRVIDSRVKTIDKKTWVKRINRETVAMAVFNGQKVDPRHLRVLKEGMLVFILPAP